MRHQTEEPAGHDGGTKPVPGRLYGAHDDLVLPDPNGHPLPLRSLFATPTDLMAALIRGGWVIPGKADRSMFLAAIIGTGPMESILADADVELLTDWVNAGAVVPAAMG